MPSQRTANTGDGGRSRIELRAHELSADGFPVLTAASAPVLTSAFDDGVDFVCAGCATVLLARAHQRQFAGVLIQCPVCGLFVSCHRLPGEAMIGASVVYPRGPTTVPAPGWIGPQMVTSEVAFTAYAREVGRRTPSAAPRAGALDWDGDTIRGWADELRAALGTVYDKLLKADARGQASRTPPASRHLMIELLEGAEAAARAFEAADTKTTVQVEVRADVVSDLLLVIKHLTRWQHHPLYQQVLTDLLPAIETRHTIATLTVGSFFADRNVGVELVEGGTGPKRGDLWLYPDLGLRVGVEVKGPEMFWARRTPLDHVETVKVIEKRIKKARSQLDHRHPAMLVVVGFHMYSNWHVLQQATTAAMASARPRENFLGTLLMNCLPSITSAGFATSAEFEIVPNRTSTIDLREYFAPTSHRPPPTSYAAPG